MRGVCGLAALLTCFSFIREDVRANKGGGGGGGDVNKRCYNGRRSKTAKIPECESHEATKQLGHCAAGAARRQKATTDGLELGCQPRSVILATRLTADSFTAPSASWCLRTGFKLAHLSTCVRVILTSGLVLVSRRAVRHLQVGLAAATVLDGLGGLGRHGRARQVGETSPQLFCNRRGEKCSSGKQDRDPGGSTPAHPRSSPRSSAGRGRGPAASGGAAAGG